MADETTNSVMLRLRNVYRIQQYGGYFTPMVSRYVIGVDRKLMNMAYAPQENTMWCWAATASMSMNIKGLQVDQKVFTYDHCGVNEYGEISNCGANPYEINVYLNGCGWDNYGKQYCVSAELRLDPLTADAIIYNLSNDYPIIAAYREWGALYGHVVLISGAVILENHYTRVKTVEQLIIRNPTDTYQNRRRMGRHIVNAGDFVQKMYAWWVPYVTCMDGGRLTA